MTNLIDLYFELCFSVQRATGCDFWLIVWTLPAAGGIPAAAALNAMTRFVAAKHSGYTRW